MNETTVIFDTSVWIDFLGNCQTKQAKLLKNYISNNWQFYTTPTIIQEILQGVRLDNDYEKLKKSLISFDCLELNAIDAAIGAAELYRYLRKEGITIRKSNDVLIAWYAIQGKLPLVFIDRDFINIATHSSLQLIQFENE